MVLCFGNGGMIMNRLQLQIRLTASGLLIFALLACAIMWNEAGLNNPGRKLNFFGGSNRIPFLQQKHPEATLTFTAIGLGVFLVSLWLPPKAMRRIDHDEPFWWTHGLGLIFVGTIFGIFLYQARYINGVPHEVWQPGAIMGMSCCAGLAITGFVVMIRGSSQ